MSKITKRMKEDSTFIPYTENLSDYSNSNYIQPQSRRSQRIQNGLLHDDTVRKDPISILLPEVLSEVYKYCSNSDLCRFRLVSSSWKNSVEETWRKRVTIYIYEDNTVGSKKTSTLRNFSTFIRNQEFDFSNRPLRRLKFDKLELTPQNYKPQSILVNMINYCGSALSHLEISDCVFENWYQFLRYFLSKFCNIRTLILTRLMERPENFAKNNCKSKKKEHQTQERKSEKFQLQVFKNLSFLKIDFSGFRFDYRDIKKPCQLPWLLILSLTPNLETLEIYDDKNADPMGFRILDVLRPIEMLSLKNKLKKLKHLEVYNDITFLDSKYYAAFTRYIVDQSQTLQRSSIALKSLKFNVCVRSFCLTDRRRLEQPGGNEFIEELLKKFGHSDLQTLQFCTWKPKYPQFPPAIKEMSLENLTHLSLHLKMGKTIKSAEQMPNLKSLEIWWVPPHAKVTKEHWPNDYSLLYLPTDHIVSQLADEEEDDDCLSKDPDYYPGDILPHVDPVNFEVAQTIKTNIQAKYSEGNSHNALFWEISDPDTDLQFKHLRHFRFESDSFLPQKLYSLPTWMPNLTSLEMPLTASDFTTVCDKLRNLQRLVVLYKRQGTHKPVSSSPIDDCAITGKLHNSNTLFVCSCNNFVPRPRRKQSVNWSYFCGLGLPAVKPNITYLQELRHFEMEGLRMNKELEGKYRYLNPDPEKAKNFTSGFYRIYNRNIYITDESVFDGFYKLPKLTYLNINAKLNDYTRKELFKRIQKCILRWPAEEESDKLYLTMQNFERDTVV